MSSFFEELRVAATLLGVLVVFAAMPCMHSELLELEALFVAFFLALFALFDWVRNPVEFIGPFREAVL